MLWPMALKTHTVAAPLDFQLQESLCTLAFPCCLSAWTQLKKPTW
jgi:hypothetical protein